MERIKEILQYIEKLPAESFSELTSDPDRMQAVRDQFHAFIEGGNVRTQSGGKLKTGEISSLFDITVTFVKTDDGKTKLSVTEDRNDDRHMLNRFLSYYASRLEVTPPRNRGELKKALACLGSDDNVTYVLNVCQQAGVPVRSDPVVTDRKTEAQKKAERAERAKKHPTGVLPVTIPEPAPKPTPQKQEDHSVTVPETLGEFHVFTPLTLDDILTTPPLDFLTDNLIVRNTVNVFFAPAKTGKTYLCLNYAVSMAMGIPFVGMENHLKRNVGYLNLDMFRGGFNDRVKQVIRGFNPNATHEYISNILSRLKLIDREAIRGVGGHIPNFFKEEYLRDLQNFIQANDIEFLFIDTFSRIREGSAENDNDDMGITLQNIEKFFTPLECGCLLIHHTGKDGKLRGASAIVDNAEFVFGLRKVNGSNKHLQLFSDTPRYTDVFELDVYPVFEQSTNEDTGASRAESYFLTAVDPDSDSNVYAKAVFDYLRSVGNVYTSKKNIAYHADGNYDLLRKEVDGLYAQGKLERVKSGSGFNYRMKTERI